MRGNSCVWGLSQDVPLAGGPIRDAHLPGLLPDLEVGGRCTAAQHTPSPPPAGALGTRHRGCAGPGPSQWPTRRG